MNFEEMEIRSFPKGAQYYFKVTLLNIGSRNPYFEAPNNMEISELWNVSEITSPCPRAIHWYFTNEKNEEIITNVVIEIHGNEISWYTTKDTER